MSGVDYWLRQALRPLRQYADFSGRSTRTELISFYILTTAAGLALQLILVPIGDRGARTAYFAFNLAILCPYLALMTRRMHDHGRSGWWLLVAASPTLAAWLWKFYGTGGAFPVRVRIEQLPMAAAIIVGISSLAMLVLLLWKDEEGPNAYGPNPRYDDPGPTGVHPEGAL